MSYRCELRLETPEKIDSLYRTSKEYYDSLYVMLVDLFVNEGVLTKSGDRYFPVPAGRWKACRAKIYVAGSKLRHIMRFPFLIKNMDNWLDQLLGKYERTYGKPLILTENERRHQFITVLKYFFKVMVFPRFSRGK